MQIVFIYCANLSSCVYINVSIHREIAENDKCIRYYDFRKMCL